MKIERFKGAVSRCALALFLACVVQVPDARASEVAVRWKAGAFEDIKERVVFAIENRGLVVNYTARIGAMLERTGADIGASKTIYANAELIEFCSAALSRAMMEADPANIVQCPHAIAVYVLAGDRGRVYVAYRRFGTEGRAEAARRAMLKIEQVLADIVSEALK